MLILLQIFAKIFPIESKRTSKSYEISGIVKQIGSSVCSLNIGDEVIGNLINISNIF